ncbi:hypothetical protein F4678DRAFT_420195 [Xylaria arbuscula]|nr:hypothetical protein F4678DRAFT_420195 [Xylaria arbuscula]
MPPDDLRPSISLSTNEIPHDIWHLIFGQLDDRGDLYNACLVSHMWSAMVTPHLYNVVSLAMRKLDPWTRKGAEREKVVEPAMYVSSRLLDVRNKALRSSVRELVFGYFHGQPRNHQSEMESRLIALVHSLPALRCVRIMNPLTQGTLVALAGPGASKQVPLHFLREDGLRRLDTPSDLPNLVSLVARVDPFYEDGGPNRNFEAIQTLLFASPSLKSFSLKIYGNYGGCQGLHIPRFGLVDALRFSGNERFPPLEELSLDGYRSNVRQDVVEPEWEQWRRRFQWHKLRSLTIGPQSMRGFLDLASGYATSLENLTVQVYDDADSSTNCPQLEHFLTTFASLQSLTVKGYHLSLKPIQTHPDLTHLCLHMPEHTLNTDPSRPTLDVKQLQELDETFPRLETLEIDINREGRWPEEILQVLATGFGTLQRLTLHLELGLSRFNAERRSPYEEHICLEPHLNKESAQDLGQQFFSWRSSRSPSSKLSVLALKTGEPLRRWPQWEMSYTTFERRNGLTIEVHRPWKNGEVPGATIIPGPVENIFNHEGGLL